MYLFDVAMGIKPVIVEPQAPGDKTYTHEARLDAVNESKILKRKPDNGSFHKNYA